MVNKRVLNAVLGCSIKTNRMISVHFQGKPFNITVIQAYAPTSNAEEAKVERFCENLQDRLEPTHKKRRPFHYRGLESKSRKSRNNWSNTQIWLWSTEWSRAKANRVLHLLRRRQWQPLQYSCLENSMYGGAWWAVVHGVAGSWTWVSNFTFTFHFHALEKEMATHSSVVAWRIPGTGKPGGLPSMGSQRVGHDWSDLAAAACISYCTINRVHSSV